MLSGAALRFHAQEREIEMQVMEIAGDFRPDRERDFACRSLPYGDQRRLEIVRALATRPRAPAAR